MRYMLRSAYLTWEFWIPGILALIAFAAISWLMAHNQDLLRQKQFSDNTKIQVEQVSAKIQALSSQVVDLTNKVEKNTQDVHQNKMDVQKVKQEASR